MAVCRNHNRRREIADYIDEYEKTKGQAPTVREIGAALGGLAASTIYGHLKRMARDGLLSKTKDPGHERGFSLYNKEDEQSETRI